MTVLKCPLAVLVLILLMLTGCSDPDPDGKLVGPVWGGSARHGASVELAFLDNHGFVRRHIHQRDGSEADAVYLGRYKVEGNLIRFEYDQVGKGAGLVDAVPFTWKQARLTLNEKEPIVWYIKPVKSSEVAIEGLWKLDSRTQNNEPAGRLFLPCGVEVLIDQQAKGWQLRDYTCSSPSTLQESIKGKPTEKRSLSFTVEKDTFTIKGEGKADQVYRKVTGDFPFGKDGFEQSTWNALK